MAETEKILIGKIAAPQGIRGEFRVQTFTAHPSDLAGFAIRDSGFVIKFIRAAAPNVAICKMDGVNDRNAAEKLRGTKLFADRADFPKLKKGEHYVADLIGMKVIRNPEFVNEPERFVIPAKAGIHCRQTNSLLKDMTGAKAVDSRLRGNGGSGISATDTNHEPRVAYVHNFGAGDILELDNGDMISFNGAVVDYEKKEIKYAK